MESGDKTKHRQNLLMIGILIGIVCGVMVGWYLPAIALKLKFLGDLFLNALRMIIIPLIVASMIRRPVAIITGPRNTAASAVTARLSPGRMTNIAVPNATAVSAGVMIPNNPAAPKTK